MFKCYKAVVLGCCVLAMFASVSVNAQKKKKKGPVPVNEIEGLMKVDADGNYTITQWPSDEKFKNPWPADLEAEYVANYNKILKLSRPNAITKVNTYFENEKSTYGLVMINILAGHLDAGMKTLQYEDVQRGEFHRHTEGIDYFAAFTIKHQMRKYFMFGRFMKPEYKARMFKGAKAWTAKDPLKQKHYAHKPGSPGWDPKAKGTWVDVRTTDNLKLMVDTSVYLMAEETGNEATRLHYKKKLIDFISIWYHIGNGEWDSENYLGHSIAPLHNLYDFAKDPEVKMIAKAGLDWFYTAAAIKYFRGGFNGPSKRDYNKAAPFSSSTAKMGMTYFGGFPGKMKLDSDWAHQISSEYRPPLAVVKLARKEIDLPMEIFAQKPDYDSPKYNRINASPNAFETQYIAHTYQFGSLAKGTGRGDENGFKIIVWSEKYGGELIQPVPGPDPKYMGSPKYQGGKAVEPNRVAQNKNIAIWLARKGDAPWTWCMPESTVSEVVDGILFMKSAKTWTAFIPINQKVNGARDEELTRHLKFRKRKVRKKVKGEDGKTKRITEMVDAPDKGHDYSYAISAKGQGQAPFSGFAVEIGEAQSHGSYEEFKKAILSKAKVDESGLKDGIVSFKASDGKTVKMSFGSGSMRDYKVWRDGKERLFLNQTYYYQNADGGIAPVHQNWGPEKGGTLTVEAGGHKFTCTVTRDGQVTFKNE